MEFLSQVLKNEGATVEITLPLILEEGDKDSAEGYDSR